MYGLTACFFYFDGMGRKNWGLGARGEVRGTWKKGLTVWKVWCVARLLWISSLGRA